MKLLTPPGNNPKTVKGEKQGWATATLHLAPANLAGLGTVCPWSTAGCRVACLNKAGRGGMPIPAFGPRIQAARIRRTRAFLRDRVAFLADLDRDIAAHVRAAARTGLRPAVRLNGTSDIPWEHVWPDGLNRWARRGIRFYDYTKSEARVNTMLRALAWARLSAREKSDPARHVPPAWPKGYHLTFSWSGENADACGRVLAAGGNVAVAFYPKAPVGDRLYWEDEGPTVAFVPGARTTAPGSRWTGWPIIDGDASDLRFLDPRGVVGLRAKGPAKRDRSGFVVRLEGKS